MIKQKLDEYLEFDSSLLFGDDTFITNELKDRGIIYNKLVRVFGGALRDIIAGQKINDVDILIGTKSMNFVDKVLVENGYIYHENLAPKDLSSVYDMNMVISEPYSYVKGTKVVQLIRPRVMSVERPSDVTQDLYTQTFIDLIANVDISCCGISYDGKNLYQNYPGAISHAKHRKFLVNNLAKMYNQKRISSRRWKLINRGWEELNGVADYRDFKIDAIFDIENFEYIDESKTINKKKNKEFDLW
jgi:hypothetical protein